MKKRNIAEDTADVILESPIVVTIAGKEYKAKRPTLATLIEVSRLISLLPNVELIDVSSLTNEKIVEINKKGMFYAKECNVLGTIIATLILGHNKPKHTILSRFSNYEKRRAMLALKIVNECSIDEIIKETQKLLNGLEAASFFVFIASLSAINLMRGAMTTTQSGQ